MKKLSYSIAVFLFTVSLFAQDPIIKIYLQDGSQKLYKIEEIKDISFIHFNPSYSLSIFKKDESNAFFYDIRYIDSIWFENNETMKILKRENLITYNISDIDSMLFVFNECEVLIGDQIWMCKNLDLERYRNGDIIKNCITDDEWAKADSNKEGAWCYMGNSDSMGVIFGKLYNWYAVNDPRGLAPEGWHIPSNDEWTTLVNFLGGESVAGGKIKDVGISILRRPNSGATNESGFTALPGGFRIYGGTFFNLYGSAMWWTSTDGYYRRVDYNSRKVTTFTGPGGIGHSVRCIKNK